MLIDPYGSIKIVFWEQDTEKVEEGGTYKFKNLRLKQSKFNQELYVNPAKSDSEITKCYAFEKKHWQYRTKSQRELPVSL